MNLLISQDYGGFSAGSYGRAREKSSGWRLHHNSGKLRECFDVDVNQAASYRGGRLKVDELYSHDFTRNTRHVASLLSNVFQSGLDDDHQHGIMNGRTILGLLASH